MYIIKQTNEDFRVSEIKNIIFSEGNFYYYLLIKDGLRTDECVDILSEKFKILPQNITYSGLKDEDGITSQYLSIENSLINNHTYKNGVKTFKLTFIGTGSSPFKIGSLSGNSFSLRVRNLKENDINKLKQNKRKTCRVLNFYDTQRFGLPNKPKVTHLIGKALIDNKYNDALNFLFKGKCINNSCYKNALGKEQEFFEKIDWRKYNFYLSAYDSFVWNEALNKLVMSFKQPYELSKESFTFNLLKSDNCKNLPEELEITRHEINQFSKLIEERKSFRQTINYINYHVAEIDSDNLNSNSYSAIIEFVLPPGSYATITLNQLLYNLEIN